MSMLMTDWLSAPGPQAAREAAENAFLWGPAKLALLSGPVIIDGSARDAGNATTTELRAGLLMGKITATGKYKQWVPTNLDGTENVDGVLSYPVKVVNADAANTDRLSLLCVGGPVKNGSLITSVTPYTITQLARVAMANHFIFDDDYDGSFNWFGFRNVETVDMTPATTGYSVTADDNGKLLLGAGGGAQILTLPTLAVAGPGFIVSVFNTVNQSLVINAPTGKLMTDGNAAATSVTYNTTSHKIGAFAAFLCDGSFYYHMHRAGPAVAFTVA